MSDLKTYWSLSNFHNPTAERQRAMILSMGANCPRASMTNNVSLNV